jgi:hypothetical protein
MLEIAGLAVAGVTALAAIIQAYNAAKAANKNISKASLKKAQERANSPLKVGVKTVAEVIDDELLETLQSEIEKQNRNLLQSQNAVGFQNISINQ